MTKRISIKDHITFFKGSIERIIELQRSDGSITWFNEGVFDAWNHLESIMALNILDFKKILKLIRFHKIDLVVIGPEEPLVKGIVDFLKKNKVMVFGPNKYAAKLEGSKAFMKYLCAKNKIPTANPKASVAATHPSITGMAPGIAPINIETVDILFSGV